MLEWFYCITLESPPTGWVLWKPENALRRARECCHHYAHKEYASDRNTGMSEQLTGGCSRADDRQYRSRTVVSRNDRIPE